MSTHPVFPQIDIDDIVVCLKNAVLRATNEEEVRIGVSRCIEDKILKPLGIKEVGRYEYLLVSGARADALYGHVIVEFKAPGKLSSQSDVLKAKEQVIKYIKHEATSKQEYGRYLGVIISDRIAFVRYDPRRDTWILRGPYDIRREVVVKLVEALRGLRRKPLDAEHLIRDFGPTSEITRKLITLLYKKLVASKIPRTRTLFEDWMRLFRQATGYRPEELEELPRLAQEYGLPSNVNYDALIFSIHTYYALLLKFIAAEIAYLYGAGKFYKSYIAELDDAYAKEGLRGLRDVLQELEGGGIFRKLLRIENFLEGDYFSWYLEELDDSLGEAIAELVRRLLDYEVATPQLEPEFARDLLKRLYQNLVPSELRHRLGEFYTPDWLANFLLDEVGLSLDELMKMGEENPLKPLELKVLDPACGSGTFLVLYISRLRRYAEEHFMLDSLVNYVLSNVVGYDLNPLAVLTARTNYLLAIADLLAYTAGVVEIPIYLADSIMVERRAGIYGDVYVLRTVVGEFEIPVSVVRKGVLREVLAEVVKCLENRYDKDDFKRKVEYNYGLDPKELHYLAGFYEKLYKLEVEDNNKIWVGIIRNAFAPILKGKFDFVIGNPPWVNWENLPDEYREISKPLWTLYGMAKVISRGGFKKDLAMLFLARCFDLYLKQGGKLGFLMPFTVFKAQAGAGFRDFLAKNSKIHVIHDLVTLYPFEGATNRTSAIVLEKVHEVERKVKHFIWVNLSNKPISTDKPLEEVLKEVKKHEALMIPVEPERPETPWMQITPGATEAVKALLTGFQHYRAHEGVISGLNQVYFIEVRGKTTDGKLIITNPPEPGQKKRVKQVEAVIEPDLVYPLIRGRNIKRWYVDFEGKYIVVPHDPKSGHPIEPEEMKTKFPNAFAYFNQFKKELKERTIKPFLSLREKIKKGKNKFESSRAEMELEKWFYIADNVGGYTFAPYKVAWGEISGAITGKATTFKCAVLELINGKPAIPDHTVNFIGVDNADEAYYIAGFLNSIVARTIIASYTYELRQETHIADIIKIPKFNPKNEIQRKIAQLSKKAHELAKCVYAEKLSYYKDVEAEEELKRVERELDLAVAELLGLSENDLKELRKLMAILSGEELPVEEVEIPQEPKVVVLNTLLSPNSPSHIEIDVTNPSREELAISYEFPWGKGSFRLIEGSKRVSVPPLSLGKYNGTIRYVWRGIEKTIDVTIEVSEISGPKRPKKPLLGEAS
jgi:type II restriction/modification system DNA methylase subunit YeeA